MANLQYIGARYVPKFYTNPDYPAPDDRNNDWKSGVFYEALTIVTYNNDSYTSKKFVPDDIGNPADNVDYWACTTKYTAALMALQTTVQNLVDYVNPDLPLETLAQTLAGAINELNKLAVFVTPEMFGAVGDGVTDDTAALQQAFDSDKPVIFESEKTYLVSDNITIASNSEVHGNGAIIKIADHSSIQGGILKLLNVHDVIIDGIAFDSNVANQDGYTIDEASDYINAVIVANGSRNVKIENCTFNGLYSTCIKVYGCGGNISISDNIFIGGAGNYEYSNMFIHCLSNLDACFIDIHDNHFTSGVTDYSVGYGAIFCASEKSKTVIKNNYFEKIGRTNNTAPLSPIDMYYNVDNAVIVGNVLRSCCMMTRIISSRNITVVNNDYDEEIATNPYTNIVLVSITSLYSTPHESYGIVISNNRIIQKSAATKTFGIGSHYDDVAPHGIIITDNYIKSLAGAFYIGNGTSDVQILNNYYEDTPPSTAAFIEITDQTTNTIDAGNFIINNNNVRANSFIIAQTDVIEGNKISQANNNILNVTTGCLLAIPFLIMGNEFISPSNADHSGVKFTQQGSEKCYAFNNLFSSHFSAISSTGVEVNKNFYNGVEI